MRGSQEREQATPSEHPLGPQALQERLLEVEAEATDGRGEASLVPGSRVINVLHREARWRPPPLALWLLQETLGCFSYPGLLRAPALPSSAKS